MFQSDKSPTVQQGHLAFQKPNQIFFEVLGDHPEKWICDGTAFYLYNYDLKELKQYMLPADQQGQPIQSGPLPFLFGPTKANDLKKRYWIRALPSPKKDANQIWIQVYPKHARDAAVPFTRAEMIFNAKDMTPIGIMLHKPDGRKAQSWTFSDFIINDDREGFRDPPLTTVFTPRLPRGWKKVVETTTAPAATPPSTP